MRTSNMDAELKQRIEKEITNHRVMLYMKGTPSFPQCGFSGHVVHILSQYGIEYNTVNVLEDPAIREGIKVYSDWPTVPQLYVDGEFVGGCDIVNDMHTSGELGDLLAGKKENA
jgi:monothiol glutaredoxin